MKAVRLHAFHAQPVIDEVPEPVIASPLDVIVKIGGAGVCRTDLHIIEGQWRMRSMGTRAAVHTSVTRTRAGCTRWSARSPKRSPSAITVILHPTTDRAGCVMPADAATTCTASPQSSPACRRDGGMRGDTSYLGQGVS